ncbi:MAG: glutathione peroxidase [Anaerolineaceae bacterium]|nr:glutathione peroxidase [Anaerolineaceae bacterium]
MSAHDFQVKDAKGNTIELKQYAGKVLLIVNTASKCGFTPQYAGLEELYKKYQEKGLVILGFPCDQFAHQEPGSDAEIQSFCQMNYGVTFPVMSKIEVNGKNAHPLYKYLRSEEKELLGDSIKWNFTKFLIDKQGNVVERFAPNFEPAEIAPEIEKLL